MDVEQAATSDHDKTSAENESNENDFAAPIQLLTDFLASVMVKDYDLALQQCSVILELEPRNQLARELYRVISRRLMTGSSSSEEDDDSSDREGISSTSSDVDDVDDDDDDDDTESDDDDSSDDDSSVASSSGYYTTHDDDEAASSSHTVEVNGKVIFEDALTCACSSSQAPGPTNDEEMIKRYNDDDGTASSSCTVMVNSKVVVNDSSTCPCPCSVESGLINNEYSIQRLRSKVAPPKRRKD